MCRQNLPHAPDHPTHVIGDFHWRRQLLSGEIITLVREDQIVSSSKSEPRDIDKKFKTPQYAPGLGPRRCCQARKERLVAPASARHTFRSVEKGSCSRRPDARASWLAATRPDRGNVGCSSALPVRGAATIFGRNREPRIVRLLPQLFPRIPRPASRVPLSRQDSPP